MSVLHHTRVPWIGLMMPRLLLILLSTLITVPALACPPKVRARLHPESGSAITTTGTTSAHAVQNAAIFIPTTWSQSPDEAARTRDWTRRWIASLELNTRVDFITYEPGTTYWKHMSAPQNARLDTLDAILHPEPLWPHPAVTARAGSSLRDAIRAYEAKQPANALPAAYIAITPSDEITLLAQNPEAMSQRGVLIVNLEPALNPMAIDMPRGSVLLVMPEPAVVQRAIAGRAVRDRQHAASVMPMLTRMLGTLWFLMGLFAFFIAWLWQRSRQQQLRHSHEGL